MQFEMTVTGVENLARQFSMVQDKAERGVVRTALRNAARNIVGTAARQNLESQGHKGLARDVGEKGSVRAGAATEALVGAKRGKRLGRIGHFLEKGTRAHEIKARRGRVLRAGGAVFARVVHHPGARPRPWLLPALEASRAEVLEEFRRQLQEQLLRRGL